VDVIKNVIREDSATVELKMGSDKAFFATILAMFAFICGAPYIALFIFIIGVL
jgi:hypothetical protein